jgi:hypothetical protein
MAIITEHGDYSKSGTVLPLGAIERVQRSEEGTHVVPGAAYCVRLFVESSQPLVYCGDNPLFSDGQQHVHIQCEHWMYIELLYMKVALDEIICSMTQ